MFSDFQSDMKGKTGGWVNSIHWFMPLRVMVDLFFVQCHNGMHKTTTLFVFKPISKDLFASLMDSGWDVKIVAGDDIIRCQVLQHTVSFRYHIGRETLYTTFGYVRDRLIGTEWVPLDQHGDVEMIEVSVELLDGTSMTFQVGREWSLNSLRQQLKFYMDDAQAFQFVVLSPSNGKKTLRKVNQRQEKATLMKDIGHDNLVFGLRKK